jgi:tetrahydromethanopterin S-methyltransferase subunit A
MAGWSIGPYGEGDFGVGNPNALVSVTGVVGSALFDPVGVAAGGEVEPAGFQHTVELGQETVITSANVFPAGVEGNGEVGVGYV